MRKLLARATRTPIVPLVARRRTAPHGGDAAGDCRLVTLCPSPEQGQHDETSNHGAHDDARTPHPDFRPLPALPEDEPEPDEGRRPHHAARGVVRQEPAIAHSRGTGHERRQRPEEPDEPAGEDGLAPVSREEAIHPLQGRAIDADPAPVLHERGAPGSPAEFIAEGVSSDFTLSATAVWISFSTLPIWACASFNLAIQDESPRHVRVDVGRAPGKNVPALSRPAPLRW